MEEGFGIATKTKKNKGAIMKNVLKYGQIWSGNVIVGVAVSATSGYRFLTWDSPIWDVNDFFFALWCEIVNSLPWVFLFATCVTAIICLSNFIRKSK